MSTHYINKQAFLKELSKRLKGVDLRKSGRMAKYGFSMEDGESFNCTSVVTMVKAVNKAQEGTLVPTVAKVAGSGFIIAWEEVTEKVITPVVEVILQEDDNTEVYIKPKKKKSKKPSPSKDSE